MSATDVIRLRADLHERFRDAKFREYAWSNLTRLRELPDDIGWKIIPQLAGHVAVAENFYVTAGMMPAVYRRAQEFPDDLPQTAVAPPADYGFCVFEEPIRWTNGQGREETLTAMSWGPGTLLDPYQCGDGGTVPGLYGRIVTCWTTINDEEQQYIVHDVTPESREWLERVHGPWRFSMLGGMWDDDPLGPLFVPIPPGEEDDDNAITELRQEIGPIVAPAGYTITFHRIMAGLWSLMNETIPGSAAIDEREPTDRATRRLARRLQLPGMVSIIRLRREEERVHGVETGRTIGVRYHVEGFWRTLHRGTAAERRVWVHEHWRGPEDAPLSMRQTVRVLVR